MDTLLQLPDTTTLTEFCHRYHVRELSIFGSAARSEMESHSDIDLLVDFLPGATPSLFTLVHMSDELQMLFGNDHEIDLVTRPSMHPLIWRHAKRDVRTLYRHEEG